MNLKKPSVTGSTKQQRNGIYGLNKKTTPKSGPIEELTAFANYKPTVYVAITVVVPTA